MSLHSGVLFPCNNALLQGWPSAFPKAISAQPRRSATGSSSVVEFVVLRLRIFHAASRLRKIGIIRRSHLRLRAVIAFAR